VPVQSVTHLGIVVDDLDRSLRFYTEALGFTPSEPNGRVGREIDALVELDGVELQYRFLRHEAIAVELLHFVSPPAVGDGARAPMNRRGMAQLGVVVTDLDGTAALVEELGGHVVPGTRVRYRADESSPEIDSVYCTDPDGVRLELMEFLV
jgi:catechol 2,3-dioxygenase-like lactoylglutathione lyase family enzyme